MRKGRWKKENEKWDMRKYRNGEKRGNEETIKEKEEMQKDYTLHTGRLCGKRTQQTTSLIPDLQYNLRMLKPYYRPFTMELSPRPFLHICILMLSFSKRTSWFCSFNSEIRSGSTSILASFTRKARSHAHTKVKKVVIEYQFHQSSWIL